MGKPIVATEIAIGIIKSGLNAIPFAGSLLVEAFFETPNRISQKRKEEHLEAVIQKLQPIDENVIDINFLQSENFSDLLQAILQKITLKQATEKAEFFSNLTVSSILKTRSKRPLDWQIRFIEIIASLNENELQLLFDLSKHPHPSQASVRAVSTPFGLEKNIFELCFDSLISKGLVLDASLSDIPQNISRGVGHLPRPRERIDISPLAKAAIQFIPEIEAIVKNASIIDESL